MSNDEFFFPNWHDFKHSELKDGVTYEDKSLLQTAAVDNREQREGYYSRHVVEPLTVLRRLHHDVYAEIVGFEFAYADEESLKNDAGGGHEVTLIGTRQFCRESTANGLTICRRSGTLRTTIELLQDAERYIAWIIEKSRNKLRARTIAEDTNTEFLI